MATVGFWVRQKWQRSVGGFIQPLAFGEHETCLALVDGGRDGWRSLANRRADRHRGAPCVLRRTGQPAPPLWAQGESGQIRISNVVGSRPIQLNGPGMSSPYERERLRQENADLKEIIRALMETFVDQARQPLTARDAEQAQKLLRRAREAIAAEGP